MSQETYGWLNQNVLIGFTDKRGNAWHYKESEQGAEPNHYPLAIPVEDVTRRLFHWKAIERPLFVLVDGDYIEVPNRKAIVRDDTHVVLGTFADGYQPHQYDAWLVDNVGTLLSEARGELGIGSAGLLKRGGQAWVSVEVPENITTPEGVEFRPNLIACTSLDGSVATTYKRVATMVVCDNTLQAGLAERGQTYKLRHTRYSTLKIADAREALAIVFQAADEFASEVARLVEQTVTDEQWTKLLDQLVPVEGKEKAALTNATTKRASLQNLWNHDDRVAPWHGTAFGALQAFNTWDAHVRGVKGQHRVERNMSDVLSGRAAAQDDKLLATLAAVTG